MKKIFKASLALQVLMAHSLAVLGAEDSANKITSSELGKGFIRMINDATGFLMIVGPIVAALAATYFVIRRAGADEHMGDVWKKRIVVAVVCGVGIGLISAVITLVSSYYI